MQTFFIASGAVIIVSGCIGSGQVFTFTNSSSKRLDPCPTCQGTGIAPVGSTPSDPWVACCGSIPPELIETTKKMNTDPPPEPEKRSWESWRDRAPLF